MSLKITKTSKKFSRYNGIKGRRIPKSSGKSEAGVEKAGGEKEMSRNLLQKDKLLFLW